ncbi:MAG: thioredoxin-like protein, partial [Benniella sp.]
FTEDSLVEFIKANSVPIMDDIGPTNYATYVEAGIPLAYYFYSTPEERSKFGPEIEALAKELKGKVNFVYIDAALFGSHAATLDLKESWPAFAIQNVKNSFKYPLDGEISIEKIKELTDGVLAGTVEPSIKSEAIPESNDGPVKVVVANNYKEIVEDLEKDVLIELYDPYSRDCKKLAPTYEKVGELYKGSNIVIAKMDVTANDMPLGVPIRLQGFPTIKFRKAGSTDYIDYTGNRNEEGFVKFITENAVNKFEVNVEL